MPRFANPADKLSTIASEPTNTFTTTLIETMINENATPPPIPIPLQVASNWQSDTTFPTLVLKLELSILVHAVRLLRRTLPPFHSDVMLGVRHVVSAAFQLNDWIIAEAATRHLLSELRVRTTFAHTAGAAGIRALESAGLIPIGCTSDEAAAAAPPVTPLYTLQLIPIAEMYLMWAQELELAGAMNTPGFGQDNATSEGGENDQRRPDRSLPHVDLSVEMMKAREDATQVFFSPPVSATGVGAAAAAGGGDGELLPCKVGSGGGGGGSTLLLSTRDLRAVAASLYRTAARGIELAYGTDAPYALKQRKAAKAATAF